MKYYIASLARALSLSLSMLLTVVSLSAQSIEELRTSKQIITWTDEDLPNYSIQISASKTPPTDPTFVKSASVVYEYNSPDGYVRYFYGKFDSYTEANKQIQSVRDMGFSGAFVSNLKKLSKSSTSSAAKAVKGVVTRGNKPITIDPNKDYVVQLGAFRYPLYVEYFENAGEVYEYRLNDKIFRYTTKPVKGTEIESLFFKMRSLGYDKAFVIEYDTYAPYRID